MYTAIKEATDMAYFDPKRFPTVAQFAQLTKEHQDQVIATAKIESVRSAANEIPWLLAYQAVMPPK